MATNREETEVLWKTFKGNGDQASRNQLIERYLPIVRYMADRVAERLPHCVDPQDLLSAGIFGLVDAIDRFDLTRGVKFETFCTSRIRGAILDELRRLDWVPRLVRARLHQLEHAYLKLERELRRAPTDSELAEALGISLQQLDQLLQEVNAANPESVARRVLEKETAPNLAALETMEDKRSQDPLESVQRRELVDVMSKSLSPKERQILILYYYEELTFKEIGALLHLSESRVSQLHTKLILRLRLQLKKKTPVLV
jgi:RNA polymerase sigma factor for flagellar operon FliA